MAKTGRTSGHVAANFESFFSADSKTEPVSGPTEDNNSSRHGACQFAQHYTNVIVIT